MTDCKWMQDEICVNADCPMRADYCPVADNEGVCKFEDRTADSVAKTDKERLVELMFSYQEEHDSIVVDKLGLADHLIANGVVVRKQGHFVTDEFGDSSCSICGEKYLNITQAFCPNCSALLVEEDK